ncbi:MAG: phosphodiester glycosidase family protein [Luteolibacter sp.]|uniref:phosphodiester glycosidase family protein n=1 Tax=Luteolibacter sp. TaxID=1962973 RepID=UPI003265B006
MKLLLLIFVTSFNIARAAVVEESIAHAGVKFRVVRVSPETVQVVWKNGNGALYRSFDKVQAAFAAQGKTVKFIMNAGIFEPEGIPSGLHIEGGNNLRPINLADAPGNFFLKPNGVCAFGQGKQADPFVGTCASWQKMAGHESWAIQSGPILLTDGKRHPAFTEVSTSKLPRNGVGLDNKGRFIFAITDKGEMVNFWDFAGLFLKLDCKDALFLDGDISQMSVNPDKPVESNQFGVMFVVAE